VSGYWTPPLWFVDAAITWPVWGPAVLYAIETTLFRRRHPAGDLPNARDAAWATHWATKTKGQKEMSISATQNNPMPPALVSLLQAKYDAWLNLTANQAQLAADQAAVVADQAAIAGNQAAFASADGAIDGWFAQQNTPPAPPPASQPTPTPPASPTPSPAPAK